MKLTVTDRQLRRWRQLGVSPAKIQAVLGWSERRYHREIARIYGVRTDADPTAEQIAERCREIQMEWTPRERFRRLHRSGSAFVWRRGDRAACRSRLVVSRDGGLAGSRKSTAG